eukprot:690745-Prymnesium_polylepis.1
MEKLLPGTLDPKDDPSYDDMERVLLDFDVSLRFLADVSLRLLINYTTGVYLLRLAFSYSDQAEPGFHYTVYHAATGAILDNMSDEPICVDDDDRHAAVRKKANAKAMRPFHAAFPDADKITITHLYLCARCRMALSKS